MLAETAPSVAVTANIAIVPAAAELVLAETAPSVTSTAGVSIVPGKGSVTLAPTAPAIAITANVAIVPPKGIATRVADARACGKLNVFPDGRAAGWIGVSRAAASRLRLDGIVCHGCSKPERTARS